MTNWLQQGGLISSIPYEEGAKADAKKVIEAISNDSAMYRQSVLQVFSLTLHVRMAC
jgi:hypothetical protein